MAAALKKPIPVGKVLLPGATAPTPDTAATVPAPGTDAPVADSVGGNSPSAIIARKKAMRAKTMGATVLGGDGL